MSALIGPMARERTSRRSVREGARKVRQYTQALGELDRDGRIAITVVNGELLISLTAEGAATPA